MKKQYLIGLLGLVAISIPMGNSLINSNTLTSSSTLRDNSGKIGTIKINEEKSEVTVFDTSNEADNVPSEGDQLQSIKVQATYSTDSNNETDLVWPSPDEKNIYVHHATNEIFKVSYNSLISDKVGATSEQGIFNLDINSVDNDDLSIWDYEIKNSDAFNLSVYSRLASESVEHDKHEIEIGSVSISDEVTEDKTTGGIVASSNFNKGEKTALVHYDIEPATDINGDNVAIESVSWIEENKDPFGNSKPVTNSETSGDLNVSNLSAGISYPETYILVEFADGVESIISAAISGFTTDYEVNEPIVSQDGDLTKTEETASVNYVINTGNNEENVPYKVDTVTWKQNGGINTFNAVTSEDINESNPNKVTGSLNAICLSPNTTYNTKIVVTFLGDATTSVEQELDPFTTNYKVNEPIVSQDGDLTKTEETASVNYVINTGNNEENVPYKVDTVTWKQNGGINTFNAVTSEDINESNPNKVTGSLNAICLSPNTTYNTKIVVTFLGDATTSVEQELDPFTTDYKVNEPIVSQDGDLTKTEETASVNYVINTGNNEENVPYKVDTVTWKQNGGINTFNTVTSKDINESDPNKVTGSLNAICLSPNTTYNTKIVVTFLGDATTSVEQELDPFTTDYKVNEPIVSQDGDLTKTEETASVNYVINTGNNEENVPYKVDTVTWKQNGGINTFNAVTSEDINESNPNKVTGSLNAICLSPNTTYNTKIVVTFLGDATTSVEQELDPFTTLPHSGWTTPEMTATLDENKTTTTSVTFDYKADLGMNDSALLYELIDIKIKDANENPLNTSYTVSDSTTGFITVNDLECNTTYSDWEMESTFENPNVTTDTETILTSLEEVTTLQGTPKVEQPSEVNTDLDNNILQVKGDIITNGSEIEKIELIKGSISVDEQTKFENIEGKITYELVEFNYSGNTDDYSLKVTYSNNNEKDTGPLTNDDDFSGGETSKDLSYLLDNGLGIGAVMGIIIGALLLVALLSWWLTYLSNKHNKDENNKEDQDLNNKELQEEQIKA